MLSHHGYDLHFPNGDNVEHFFMRLLVMCLVSLDKFQLKSFSHLLTGFVVVVGLSSLYIPDVCMCGCSVTQSYLTLCDPMDCSLPGSSVHGIFQARILEWVAISTPGDLPVPVIYKLIYPGY